MYVSLWWIAAEKKPGKTGTQWCADRCDARVAIRVTERECFYWPEECKIVCRSGFANVNSVFLICLMFIFDGPIQITLFRIRLVSVIKCVTGQVHFWINKKKNGHSLLGLAWKSAQRRIYFNYLPWSILLKIRCILLNERPRGSSLVPITWANLPCLSKREWRVSLHFSETKKPTPLFNQHTTKAIINRIFKKLVLLDQHS